jgi:hypothetical protein
LPPAREGGLHAIIPADHKLLLLCRRTARLPRQQVPRSDTAAHYTITMRHRRGSFVMFKFYVDGEALSEGQLHEASTKAPNLHFAKAHIDTHPVEVTDFGGDSSSPFRRTSNVSSLPTRQIPLSARLW